MCLNGSEQEICLYCKVKTRNSNLPVRAKLSVVDETIASGNIEGTNRARFVNGLKITKLLKTQLNSHLRKKYPPRAENQKS